jgi:hypothetical protein
MCDLLVRPIQPKTNTGGRTKPKPEPKPFWLNQKPKRTQVNRSTIACQLQFDTVRVIIVEIRCLVWVESVDLPFVLNEPHKRPRVFQRYKLDSSEQNGGFGCCDEHVVLCC